MTDKDTEQTLPDEERFGYVDANGKRWTLAQIEASGKLQDDFTHRLDQPEQLAELAGILKTCEEHEDWFVQLLPDGGRLAFYSMDARSKRAPETLPLLGEATCKKQACE